MSEWQPISTAPKDGSVFLAYFGEELCFVAWCPARGSVREVGHLWWKKRISESDEAGFRVVAFLPREMRWCIHGNYGPFTPAHWMPLPAPPAEGGQS